MAWIYSAGSVVSHWPLPPGFGPSPTASDPRTHVVCSCPGWLTDRCALHQFGTTSPLFGPKPSPVSMSISSPADSHARTSALQVLARAWRESEAGFIARSSASPLSFDRPSCSWKTSPPSENMQASLSATWPRWGSIVGGQLYRQLKLGRTTSAIDGGSLLPMPTASPYGSSQNGSNSSRPSAGTLSLQTRDARGEASKLWPTPTRADSRASARGTTTTGVMHAGESLTDRLRSETGQHGDLLSPRFVEWMMGYPRNWSDWQHWATPSCPEPDDKPFNT